MYLYPVFTECVLKTHPVGTKYVFKNPHIMEGVESSNGSVNCYKDFEI